MVKHSLEVKLVDELGIPTAVVYEVLHDLCQEQEKKNVGYHDGRFWVRMPCRDFPKVFPYLHSSTVFKAIRKLRDEGLVIVGHYDETNSVVNWYSTI